MPPSQQIQIKHFLNLLSHTTDMYSVNDSDTLESLLDKISKQYNYNFFKHLPVFLHHRQELPKVLRDVTVKFKDLPIYTESYLSLTITPSQYEIYKKEGYTTSS